jgi:hypothetical protein
MANEVARRGGDSLAKRGESAVKKHAKKAAKHPAKKAAKHASKAAKHAKKAAKHVKKGKDEVARLGRGGKSSADLEKAFHHLHRAAAVISLIEQESGGDLRMLLVQGIEVYSLASGAGAKRGAEDARSALGLLRAAEHLAMAGLYSAREKYHPAVEVSVTLDDDAFEALRSRLSKVTSRERKGYGSRAQSMGLELLKRSEGADQDPHLAWELRMAVEGLCSALEAGL